MQRTPAVAGQFYPGYAESLRKMLAELIPPEQPKGPALGIVVPHAGYIYSGAIAGATFARVNIPSKVVILGPNHHGLGAAAAVYSEGTWITPLGETAIEKTLAGRLVSEVPGMSADNLAHRMEHSLEVQLPFIQQLAPTAEIVPVCLSNLSWPKLRAMGEVLGEVLASLPQPALLVASSDMTHYESGAQAASKDQLALDRILALDPEGLYCTVREQRISMCGVIPVVLMLVAAQRLGATAASLVRYGNSGEVTGDQTQVVGYAGLVIA